MTIEWLRTGKTDNIAAFITKCDIPDNAYFLGEQQPTWVVKPAERQDLLLFVDYEPTLPFAAYTSGRIFHDEFELRWQKDNGQIQVVYLGNEDHCPQSLLSNQDGIKEDIAMQRSRQYYLFGELLRQPDVEKIGKPAREGDYAEVRIPRLLRYPVHDEKRRVLVTIRESIDEKTGEVEQYRFQKVEGGE
jgi:hypothetical protein